MTRQRPDVRPVLLAVRLLAHLSEELLVGDSPATEREMLKRSRQLTRVLELRLTRSRRPNGKVVELERVRSRRQVAAALGISPRPPRAA